MAKNVRTIAKEKVSATPDTLSEAERFYVEHNQSKSAVEIAAVLDKPVKLIQKHIESTSKKKETRVQKLLQRPAKGVLSMTEGASMAADDRTRNIVTSTDIQKAIAEGDLDKAAKLQKDYNTQQEKQEKERESLYGDRIHRIW